ncbi:MAG: diguanylate cyclase [Pseudohongiellaceae bacterium]
MTVNSDTLLPKVMDLLIDAICVVDEQGRYVFVSAACERIFGYTQEELLGRNMIELVHPEDRELTLEVASQIMAGKPQAHFENRYLHKDGRTVHIMWSARWSEAERLRLAVARDVTELRRTERTQSAIYQISEAVHHAESLVELYGHIHQIIGKLLPADNFFVALYDQETDILSFPYFVDERAQTPQPQALDLDTPIALVIREGQPLLLNSEADHGATDEPGSAVHLDYGDCLGVPLVSQPGVMGAVVVHSYTGTIRYTEEDKSLLQFVSTQVAIAIERKQVETRLRHMAQHDPLTDLPNRTLFNEHIDAALKRAHRNKEQLGLLYLDLDNFKETNDSFGHEAGDRLLCEVANRLRRCVRDSDMVGRMGGDEFTVLLHELKGEHFLDLVIEKIASVLNEPCKLDGRNSLRVSASIGAAIYPDHGREREQLFRHADAHMYSRKRKPA